MEQLLSKIKTQRPKLSDSSLRSYKSVLSSLYRRLRPNTDFNCDVFETNSEEIITFLKDVPPQHRKTKLSALLVAVEACNPSSPTIDKYRELMMSDANTSREHDRLQVKSQKQEENWLSWNEIKTVWSNLKKQVAPLFSKERMTTSEFQQLQDFVILSVYTLIKPRRIQDYTELKIKNVDKSDTGKDNYIDKKQFVFRTYKTAKTYNEQRVDIPPSLKTILNKWIRINPFEYLFVDVNGNQLSQPQLTLRLNRIFSSTGRKVSANILRHSYLSELLKDMPALSKLDAIAREMGHDFNQQILYAKKK